MEDVATTAGRGTGRGAGRGDALAGDRSAAEDRVPAAGHDVRGTLTALGVFGAQKLTFLLAVLVASRVGLGGHLSGMGANLTRWDAAWYLGIVEHGYSLPAQGHSNLAFFPLLPLVAKGLTLLGPSPRAALLLVAWTGSLLAAWGIFVLGRTLADARTGVLLVALWGAAPRALVQVMGYAEGPYTAAVAWTMVLLLRRRWVAAGVVAAVGAGLRPPSVVLIATLGLVTLVGLLDRARRRRDAVTPPPLAGVVMTALPGLALLAVLVNVARYTGSITGYLQVQHEWRSTQRGLPTTWNGLTRLQPGMSTPDVVRYQLLVTLALVVYVALLVWMVRAGEPWPLVVFVALSLVLTAVMGDYLVKARWMIAAFPAFLPLARWLARRPRGAQVVAVLAVTAFSVAVDVDLISHRLWA